ncbi:unnamed protein product [Phytophthora fragariaefolia]|uniref:Unnamed protein product n=1 Tax=Phytophthora fragariaefolia TaxID=1490495 RepID=A0A9W6WVR1_9STRA|nr:unnamed protein product [Phytophthora fragariaefolia]
MASQFDWKQLGLGLGPDTHLMYDATGEAISGSAETAKKYPLSLATLRAQMVMIGVGDKVAEPSEQNTKPAASKGKARALEVKAEKTTSGAAAEEQADVSGRNWQSPPTSTGEDETDEEAKTGMAAVLAVFPTGGDVDMPEVTQSTKMRRGLRNARLLHSGGRSKAARKRQRRTEQELADARHMLVMEFRDENAERAKVLRRKVRQVIAELREVSDLLQRNRDRRDAQVAAAIVQQGERALRMMPSEAADVRSKEEGLRAVNGTIQATTRLPQADTEPITEAEWRNLAQHYTDQVPKTLVEAGSLAEMRAVRRQAAKEAKRYRAAKRARRFQNRRELLARLDAAAATGRAADKRAKKRETKRKYHYEQQGSYGDVELRADARGKSVRVGQLRATGSGNPSCLPTALLALTRSRMQEVRLDSCAQYSVAGEELGRFGRCVTRNAPVDVVEGFGGALSRVIGVWQFTGTTQYQQTIVAGGKRHLMMAPTVDTVRNGKVQIAVLNVGGKREKLPAREALGTGIPADEEMQILALNGELEKNRVAEWVSTLRKEDAETLKDEEKLDIGELEAGDRDLVIALLRQYAGIVEKKEGCPSLSKTGALHHINTGDAAPIMQRRRRHAVSENAVIEKEVDEMLRNGVIEEGSGAWGFLVVLVKKKDGSVRFCIDYRALNTITVKDVYPLPRVDETLEALHGAQRFTSLDLHAGHVVELAVVLERLAEAGLSLKAAKGTFAATSMEYLGHDLTPEGIKPTGRLIKAIADFPTPSDEAAVRRFVALVGYYRRFLPDLGSKMVPLTKLLRKTSEWTWGESQEVAFAWAIAWLSKKPVLIHVYSDYRLPFKLATDTSKTGLGAALSQDQGKGDQPVVYASKVNSPQNHVADALSRGPATEDEQEADTNGGVITESIADVGGSEIQASSVESATIRAIAGCGETVEASIMADGNRMPLSAEGSTAVEAEIERAANDVVRTVVIRRVEAAEMGIVQIANADIKREQEKSVMVQTIKERGAYRGQKAVIDDDGLVNIEIEGGETRIVLPAAYSAYWALAFKEAHDSIWAGHLRGPQAYERLRRMYWWPQMRAAVFNWLSACQDCASLTEHGNRYVIAAVEYTTRYTVAEAVPEHTAKAIARFLMQRIILVYGSMREMMMDGAMDFGSQAINELLELMQVKQSSPVPYRPKLLGLVERFHRAWKDMVSLYVNEVQNDWDDFLPCALYAYNGSAHATHGYQPNGLMMGRKLRTPAELLRRSNLKRPHQTLDAYHEVLIHDLKTAQELVALIHEAAGYDNYLVKMLESGQELVTHCSFLLPYYYPSNLLGQMARDIALDLREEAVAAANDERIFDDDREDQNVGPQIDGPNAMRDILVTASDRATATNVDAAADLNDNSLTRTQEAAATLLETSPDTERRTAATGSSVPITERSTTAVATRKRRRGRPRKNTVEEVRTTDESVRKRPRTEANRIPPGDAITGQTRARIRSSPYPKDDDDDHREQRESSPNRTYAAEPHRANDETRDSTADSATDDAAAANDAAVSNDAATEGTDYAIASSEPIAVARCDATGGGATAKEGRQPGTEGGRANTSPA